MSDTPISTHPGTISPRNIDTRRYRVVKALPNPKMPAVGDVLETWPQGETFAFVTGVGLGVCRNADIAEWIESGALVVGDGVMGAAERATDAGRGSAATPAAPEAV